MDKIILFVKNNPILSIISIILTALSMYHQDLSFVVILIYMLFLKLLSSKIIKRKTRKSLEIGIWTAFVIMICLMFYVNHYMPHGPNYSTGDYVCANGDRGPCREEYKEDISGLNIPDWAKFIKSGDGWCLIFGLLVAGVVAKKKDNEVT